MKRADLRAQMKAGIGVGGAGQRCLLVLFAHANDQGVAWPAVETIAELSGLSKRSVQLGLRDLEEAGLVEVERGGGRGRPNVYRILAKGAMQCAVCDEKGRNGLRRNDPEKGRKGRNLLRERAQPVARKGATHCARRIQEGDMKGSGTAAAAVRGPSSVPLQGGARAAVLITPHEPVPHTLGDFDSARREYEAAKAAAQNGTATAVAGGAR